MWKSRDLNVNLLQTFSQGEDEYMKSPGGEGLPRRGG